NRLPMADDQSVGVWAPDSARVAFSSRLTGTLGSSQLFIRNADGNGAPEPVPNIGQIGDKGSARLSFANTWTPDGTSLVVGATLVARMELWLLPLNGKAEPRRLFDDPTGSLEAAFSPDGRWLAYSSGGPARSVGVYVRPYPALDRREQVA